MNKEKYFFYFPLSTLYCFFIFCGFSPVSEIKNERGNYFYKKGELGKARTEYKGALKSDPAQTTASYNLGNTFYKEDSYESSSQAYEKASQNEKDPLLKSKAYYNLGNSLYRQQQNEKAVEAYKNALRLNPRDQDAKYNLELLTKKNENKKEDQKKQDQKKEDQKKEDQKKDQQSQNGGQGQQDQQNQGGGQGQEDKKDQGGSSGQDKKEGDGEKGEKKQDAGGAESKEEGQEKEDERSDGQDGGQDPKSQGEEEKKEPGEQAGGQGQQGQEEKEEEAKPRTAADIRAEQILGALENQEQQVLKLQGSKKNPRIQGRRLAEKDW